MSFQILSELVKESLVTKVEIPDITENVSKLHEEMDLYEKAGFTSKVDNIERRISANTQKYKLFLELWKLKKMGYLVIKVSGFSNYEKRERKRRPGVFRSIHHRFPFRKFQSGQEEKKVTTQGWVFSHTKTEIKPIYKYAGIIPTQDFIGDVPTPVLSQIIEFQQEYFGEVSEKSNTYYRMQNAFSILTVENSIGKLNSLSAARQDPLVLYRPVSDHWLNPSGYYGVIAWWGADVEDVEKALGLGKESFPLTSVFSALSDERGETS